MAVKDLFTEEKDDFKLSEENAVAAARQFINYYRLKPPAEDTPKNIKDVTLKNFEAFVALYRRGVLSNKIDEQKGLTLEQKLKRGSTLTWRELKGGDKIESRKVLYVVTGGEAVITEASAARSLYVLAGRLTGHDERFVEDLPVEDVRDVEVIATIFTMAF
jgi:hypothetical protein